MDLPGSRGKLQWRCDGRREERVKTTARDLYADKKLHFCSFGNALSGQETQDALAATELSPC